jgi:hypothetical protein
MMVVLKADSMDLMQEALLDYEMVELLDEC